MLNTTCPESYRIEESQTSTRIIETFRSLPVHVTATPFIGNITIPDTISHSNVTWSLYGNDPTLILGQNLSVTLKVSYVDTKCSGVTSQTSVLANCVANATSSNCTTQVLKVSKLQSSLRYLYALCLLIQVV